MKAILVNDMVVSLEGMKTAKIMKANTKNFHVKVEYHSGEMAFVGYGDKEEMQCLLRNIYNRYTSES